jgi:type IV pilus assembly protein PilB
MTQNLSTGRPGAHQHSPGAKKPRKTFRLGDYLIGQGLISQEQLQSALEAQKRNGERLGSVLVSQGYLREEQLAEALSLLLDVQATSSGDLEVDPEVVRLLPEDFVQRFEIVPVHYERGTLTVATATPRNLSLLDEVRFITGIQSIDAILATEIAIRRVIEQHYSTHALLQDIISKGGLIEKALRVHQVYDRKKAVKEDRNLYKLQADSEARPIVSLVNFLLIEAVRRRASDIHIEPYEDEFRVRMRIDGMLHQVLAPPMSLHKPMVSRVKIMAGMDISKTRIPQDGHIGLEYMGEVLHYRVNTLPTVAGEKCVVRLLKKEVSLNNLNKLGIPEDLLREFKRYIRQPQGLVLVTGPTGSGKTSTVHAALREINDMETNIVTLENPVEAKISGINHVEIHKTAGLTFMEGLKAILRQDPDVVFLGEIRDREVAKIAMEASMTGHLVFSTLHTNGALESLARLQDMEVEMFLIAGSLKCVVAQRLIRRSCPQCKVEVQPNISELRSLGLSMDKILAGRYYAGQGCNHCMGSGYKGRVATYEMLFVDAEIRQMIRARAPLEEVAAAARRKGMRTMLESALEHVLSGLTTVEEVSRSVGSL